MGDIFCLKNLYERFHDLFLEQKNSCILHLCELQISLQDFW